MHIYIQTYIHTYIHTNIHTYIHNHMHTYIKTYICVYIMYKYACICAHKFAGEASRAVDDDAGAIWSHSQAVKVSSNPSPKCFPNPKNVTLDPPGYTSVRAGGGGDLRRYITRVLKPHAGHTVRL